MAEIQVLENIYGRLLIEVMETVKFLCLGGPAIAEVRVRYTPKDKIMEFTSFRDWLDEAPELKKGITESIVDAIYNKLKEVLSPYALEVAAEVGGRRGPTGHGPAKVRKGKIIF